MTIINELQLSKELIRIPSVTPEDAGAIKLLSKKLKKTDHSSNQLIYEDDMDEDELKNLDDEIN